MYLYTRYYVLGHKNRKDYFLNEDKTYTNILEHALKFSTWYSANEAIIDYKNMEVDEDYTGDFIVHNNIEVRTIEILVK